MFWTNNYVSSPHIEALLNKEDVTLHELMDEEDILQECKSQNKRLVEYLTRTDVMEELVALTTREPSADIEERWRYKYPNVACELLTCDVPTLNEKLAGDEILMAKLYSFIDTDKPLNPLLASFFSKTIGVLVARKSDQNWYSYQFTCLQVLEFLKSRQTCVDLLLRHLETSAIMDLILKFVTQVEGNDMRQNILNWLDSQQLVQRLVKLLSPSSELTKHANAAQLLCDMVTVIRENLRTSTERTDPDPILNTLESPDTVSLLLETILTGEKLESSIVGGIQVLLALLGQQTNNTTNEGDAHANGGAPEDVISNEQRIKISNGTLPYLEQLHKLLIDPPHKPAIKTTAGVLEYPFGNTRLHVAKLIMALLTTNNIKIYETLVELGTFQTLLDLFFKYTWNNFLHTQVQQCLALAVNCDFKDTDDIIYANIFIKCKLIDRILEAWDTNDTKQQKENGIRQGYMGHLINIANNIVTQREKCDKLDSFLKTNILAETLEKWDNLISTQLAEINKTHQIMLGEQVQVYKTNSDGNPDEYNTYFQEVYNQQVYSNYLGQPMTSQFIENFAVPDDAFNDGVDALHEEDLDKREDMFNKMCQQKQKAGLEDCNSGMEWGDEGELTFQTVVDKRDWPTKQQHNDSNSSDEDEDDPRVMQMEVDSTEAWDSREPLATATALPEVSPWDVESSEPVESTGWANFDNFETSLNIENTVIVEKKSCNESRNKNSEKTVDDGGKEEETLENRVPVEKVEGTEETTKCGDTSSGVSLQAEENLNNASAECEGSLYSADKNANPSEASDARELGCGEDSRNADAPNPTTINTNVTTSADCKVSCSLKNVLPSEAASPPKDTK